MTIVDFQTILPELVLTFYAMVALLYGAFAGGDILASRLVWVTSGLFLFLALLIGLGWGDGDESAFGGLFVSDGFSIFVKVVILLSGAAVLMMSHENMRHRGQLRFEYPVLVSLAVIGMMVMVSAADLMTLYMGLELQSLVLYVIAAMRRQSAKSSEAGLKYFVLGALSSGMFLYGASLTYGFAGTTRLADIMQITGNDAPLGLGLLIALVMMLSAMAFKISAAPFHMWAPDVYEGSPTAVTAFFATVPKVAALALLARLVHDGFGEVSWQWSQVLAALAVASVFWGAIAAIGQSDIKRLMAYSSIAHMGYALIGLASGTAEGVQAMLVYASIYVVMNIGTFAFILSMERDGRPVSDIQGLNMLSKTQPLNALVVLVLMFSLAGVPPMLGFFAKFYVLKAAVDAGMVWLAVAGVIASVVGAFYYLRIVFLMYFGKENSDPLQSHMPFMQQIVMLVCAAAMLLGILNLFGIEPTAATAARSLVF